MNWKKIILPAAVIIIGIALVMLITLMFMPVFKMSKIPSGGGSYDKMFDNEEVRSMPAKAKSKEHFESVSIPRKLIRRAELNLEVKNCADTSQKILGLVNSVSGIIIDSQIQKYPNEAKRGYTVLKVPPKDFDTILVDLKKLGKVELERVTGEDVTEEYIDLGARLRNSEVVRGRLVKILEEKAHQVKDILEIERELGRVNETIEQITGRMKYLDRQVDLATITVNYYETKALVPEPLNITKRFKDTIRTAIEAFINVFNGMIVVVAVIIPIAIWASIIITIILVVRKLFLRR